MVVVRKRIASGSRWLLAAFILLPCLGAPVPCAAASSTDLAVRANHLLLPSRSLAVDPPEIFIPKPPPLPPPAV